MKSLIPILTAAALAALISPAAAQTPPAPSYGPPITLEQAKIVMASAEGEARKRGVAVSITISDPTGTIILAEHMTGATYASVDTSRAKARSAAMWMRPTDSWIDGVSKGMDAAITYPDVVAARGGELIMAGGHVVGGIGIGGSAPNEGDIAKMAGQALK